MIKQYYFTIKLNTNVKINSSNKLVFFFFFMNGNDKCVCVSRYYPIISRCFVERHFIDVHGRFPSSSRQTAEVKELKTDSVYQTAEERRCLEERVLTKPQKPKKLRLLSAVYNMVLYLAPATFILSNSLSGSERSKAPALEARDI